MKFSKKSYVGPISVSAILVALVPIALFQNCSRPVEYIGNAEIKASEDPPLLATEAASTAVPAPVVTPVATPTIPPANAICDINSAQVAGLRNGLVAELFYRNAEYKASINDVLQFELPIVAKKSDKTIFFGQINTPPQNFSYGFSTSAGEFVKNDSGTKLEEWFSLKYASSLMVTTDAEAGYYEFSSLSDDGFLMEVFVDGKWVRMIDNNGTHSPRLKCSVHSLKLEKNKPVQLRAWYYQGPRTLIANMLLWRKVTACDSATAGQPGLDPAIFNAGNQILSCTKSEVACAIDGNSNSGYANFFNTDTKTALQPYLDLEDRGWKVVPSKHFILPGTLENPCAQGK